MRQYLQSTGTSLAALPIVAKAFASGEGLAHVLTKAGIAKQADSHHVLSRFTCGFSQADDMFDFVLVGKGKDRADHKVIGKSCWGELPGSWESDLTMSPRCIPTIRGKSILPAHSFRCLP